MSFYLKRKEGVLRTEGPVEQDHRGLVTVLFPHTGTGLTDGPFLELLSCKRVVRSGSGP